MGVSAEKIPISLGMAGNPRGEKVGIGDRIAPELGAAGGRIGR